MRQVRSAGVLQAIFLAVIAIAFVYLFPGPAFAADFDGDGIDDAFDNCSAVYNPAQLNTDEDLALNGASVAGDLNGNACDTDDDDDGRSDQIEIYIGTSPLDNCGEYGWWADLIASGNITISDVLAIKPSFNSTSGDPNYRVRHDVADANGNITISDVLALKPVFNTTCTQATAYDVAPVDPPNRNLAQEPPLNAAANCDGPSCVYLHSGESTLSLTLMSIPSRGFSYILDATYRSGVIDYDSPLGYGWDFNQNRRLFTEPDSDVVVISGYGRTDLYSWTGSIHTAPPGRFSRLIVNGDTSYTERLSDGTVIEYDIPDANDISRMESVTDRNGNTMTYAYDGLDRLITVTDTLGRDYDYAYNLQGRLETVTDYTGRSIRFLYDGEYDLVKIMSPTVSGTPTGNDFADGRQTRFEYDANDNVVENNHNLLRITMPNETIFPAGPPLTEYTYDGLDRVTSESTGGTNQSGVPSGGTTTYDYSPSGGCTAPEDTCLTDPNGNDTEYRFNPDGTPTRATVLTNRNINASDPASFITEYVYDADSRLIRIDLPEGNAVEYDYDAANPDRLQQGNILEIRDIPDVARGGDQPLLTTTYTYDPIYNLRRTITTPRGEDATYVPQNGGAQSAARYTTTLTLDYEEDCDFTAIGAKVGRTAIDTQNLLTAAGMCGAPLGEVNGDADVTQVSGNIIRVEEPDVELLPGGPQAIAEGTTTQIQTELIQMNLVGQPIVIIDPEANVHTLDYYSEQDPDGNGIVNNPGGDPTTGGFLEEIRMDTASDPIRNTGTDPTPADAPRRFEYNDRGALSFSTDGRGTESAYTLNQLDEVILMSRADSVGAFVPAPTEVSALVAEAFVTRYHYDYNGNLLVSQREDSCNTTQSDANIQNILKPTFVPDPDPLGGVPFLDTTYEYDIMDRRVLVAREHGNVGTPSDPVTEYRYDRNGNRAVTFNPTANLPGADPDQQLSNVRSYLYDERDLLFTETRGGMTAQFRADNANADIPEVPGTPDSADISTFTFDYDGNDNVIRAVDSEDTDGVGGAEETRFLYDGYDRLVSSVDAAGNQSYHQYDPDSNLVSTRVFGPVGGATPTSNGAANFTQPFTLPGFTQPLLLHTDYLYDEASRVFETNEQLFVSTGVATVRVPVLTDGPLGGTNDGTVVTRFEYDRNDRMTFRIEDDTDTDRSLYDGYDRVINTVDPEANEVEFAYDDNTNLIEIRELDVAQLLAPPTPDEVFLTTYEYDSLNRMIRVTDNIGHSHTTVYDSRDNIIQRADAEGPVTGATVTRRAFAPGALTNDNINDEGNTTNYVYDGLDRRISTFSDLRVGGIGGNPLDLGNPANPDGRVVTDIEYDVNSRSVASADDGSTGGDQNVSIGQIEPAGELGNVTRTVYDDLNRVIQYDYDDATSRTFVYDRDDNVTQMTDQNGSVFTHTYDGINRLVSTTVVRAPGVVGTTSQTFEYDGLSRRTLATDNNDPGGGGDDSTVIRAYDSLSRVIEESQQVGVAPANVVSYQWAGDDNMVLLIYPDSRQVSYTYDGLDRVATVQSGGEPQPFTEFTYIGTSRVLERQYRDPFSGNPLIRLTYRDLAGNDVGYDGARRPFLHQQVDSFNNPIATYEYQYGRMNQVEREGRLHANRENVIEYDSLYRVVDFQRDLQIAPPGPPLSVQNYQLDGNSNWANFATPNNVNEYDVFQGQPRVYDNNGNLIDDNTTQFDFDAFNRLVDTNDKFTLNPTSHHLYDADNRTTAREVFNSGPLNDVFEFSYTGSELIHENRLSTGLQQYVSTSAKISGKADLLAGAAAIQVQESSALLPVLRMDRAAAPGQPTFFHEDGLGNVGVISDPFQNVTERYTYDAFGVTQFEDPFNNPQPIIVSNQSNPFLYQGLYWEPENELFDTYYGSYKALEGRSISRADFFLSSGATTVLGDVTSTDSSAFSLESTGVAGDITIEGNNLVAPAAGGGLGFTDLGFSAADSSNPILLEWTQWHAPNANSTIEVFVVPNAPLPPVFFSSSGTGCSSGGICAPSSYGFYDGLIGGTSAYSGVGSCPLQGGGGVCGHPDRWADLGKLLESEPLPGLDLYDLTPISGFDLPTVIGSGTPLMSGTLEPVLPYDELTFGYVQDMPIRDPVEDRGSVIRDRSTGRERGFGFGYVQDMPVRRPTGPSAASSTVPDDGRPIVTYGYVQDMPVRFGYVQDMPVRRPLPPGFSLAPGVGLVQFGYVQDMPAR